MYTETPDGECEMEAEEVITLHTLLAATSPSQPQETLLPEDQMLQVKVEILYIKLIKCKLIKRAAVIHISGNFLIS